MSLAIRPFAPEDLDGVMDLAAGCAEAPRWPRTVYEGLFAHTGALQRFALVAERAQALAGFAVATWLPQEAEAELETMAVAPDFRRQGVATTLLRAVMLASSQAGAAALRLEVRASNAAALALYRQNGFAATGTRRAYYSVPVEDAVLLRAPLSGAGLPRPL